MQGVGGEHPVERLGQGEVEGCPQLVGESETLKVPTAWDSELGVLTNMGQSGLQDISLPGCEEGASPSPLLSWDVGTVHPCWLKAFWGPG